MFKLDSQNLLATPDLMRTEEPAVKSSPSTGSTDRLALLSQGADSHTHCMARSSTVCSL